MSSLYSGPDVYSAYFNTNLDMPNLSTWNTRTAVEVYIASSFETLASNWQNTSSPKDNNDISLLV